MEGKKISKKIKAGGILSFLIIGVIAGGMYLATMNDVIEQTFIEPKRETTLVVGDNDPGDNSGYFYFMIYPHQGTPATAYASNLSNATAYEFSDAWNVSATGQTPYGTAFDVVFKIGVTDEDGTWSSNGTWNDAYMWMHVTCAGTTPAIGADTNMTEIEIVNTTNYRWMHYYLNNAGSGYTITEAQSFNVTDSKLYVQRIS